VHLIKHENGIPLLLKTILTSNNCARFRSWKTCVFLHILKNPFPTNIKRLNVKKGICERQSYQEWCIRYNAWYPTHGFRVAAVRRAPWLVVQFTELLYWAVFPAEPAGSFISCGIDSISSAQIRGRTMNRLEVEIPMKFLFWFVHSQWLIGYDIWYLMLLTNLLCR
jgi:hypothetical protein